MRSLSFWAWPGPVLAVLALVGARPCRADSPVFSGEEAQAWVVKQCALGPRVPGTPAHAAWLTLVRGELKSLGLSVSEQAFKVPRPSGYPDRTAPDPLECTNLVASIRPGVRPRLLIGAHWDSRPWADQDPDPAVRLRPVLGANDGGSGVAILLVLARLLKDRPPPFGVDLAFFDGEDLGRPDRAEEFCQGSQWMATHWQNPLPDWVIVLDMVGSQQLEIGREEYSAYQSPELLDLIFQIARNKGYGEWNPQTSYAVVDDHIAFQRLGVPAIDLIGFNDPVWHTGSDDPSRTSPRSLGRVGDVLTTLIYGGFLKP
jgi:glutaminyl-peptide cyclotransferase